MPNLWTVFGFLMISGAASDMESDIPESQPIPANHKKHKPEGSRLRLSDAQKGKAVEHFLQTPGMKQAQLGDWCKEQFKLQKPPSAQAVSEWLQEKERKRLLDVLTTEINPHTLGIKTHHKCQFPELESELFSWFKRNEMRGGCFSENLLVLEAKKIAEKRGIDGFHGGRHWLQNFKKRAGIDMKVLHGEAGSADVTYVHIARAMLPSLLNDVFFQIG